MYHSSPFVTVVTPTFNRDQLIGRAIKSVMNQTYRNWELIIIDDGSTDNTYNVVQEYIKKDQRIHYFYQNNQGQSVARNNGIFQSKGDLIAFLDSDNYWLPDKLSEQIKYWNQYPDYDIVYSDGYVIDEHDNRIPRKLPRRFSGNILPQLLQKNFVSNNTALAKKGCFLEMGGFDEELTICEDFDLWLRFATRYRFLYHPHRVFCYSIDGPRLSSNTEKAVAANYRILARFFENYPQAYTPRERRLAWASFYRWSIMASRRNGASKPWQDLMRAMTMSPLDSRNWRLLAKMCLGKQ